MKYYGPVITEEDYEKAAKNGISKSNVYQRVNEYGWEIERAITVPIRKRKGEIANDYLDMYKNDCLRVYIFAFLVYYNFIWSDGHDTLGWVTSP